MLIGRGDLGLPNLVVLVLLLLIFPSIAFIIIRNKWRHAAARREEIKRLLIFASEEAARAEIEASQPYLYSASSPDSAWIPASDSAWLPKPIPIPMPPVVTAAAAAVSVPVVQQLKPPYKCAVCFSPTSTRCAKCKAARYCSGRCQIIHWRQGHKDECRPYVAVKPVKDVSSSSSKQEDGKDSNAASADGNRPETGSAFESSSEYSTFSTPSRSSIEASSISSEDSDVTSENFMTVESSTGSVKIDQNKSNHRDEDIQPRFSTTSSRVDDGPIGSSFSEYTTTSYGHMGGNLHSMESTVDELKRPSKNTTRLDNSVPNGSTSSSRVFDGSTRHSFSESSTTTSGFWGGTLNSKKSMVDELDGSNKNTTILDKSAPNGSGSKKSNDGTSSKEILINGLKSTNPPKFISETLKHKDVVGGSDLPQSMLKETKVASSSVKDSSKAFGGVPSATLEKPTHVVNTKSSTSPALNSTSRLASQYTKPVTVLEEKSKVSVSSSKLAEHSGSGVNEGKTSTPKVVDQPKTSKLPRHCSQKAESDASHKYSCKGLFSYEMFVKLYNWKQIELRPFGLVNCGNR
ncbi:hypothetical protein M8C21_016655 [Ambrosia artemisiifolia]|uniref:MYND-type domain-containing protein n=1 Tax=Ambrosia artemisiifolia TaxID=4212 RepID=A0AAD5GGM9_AMBAR|nr:hypothetical protein M8C21_016655 [Ambrosia artemisiifolia]